MSETQGKSKNKCDGCKKSQGEDGIKILRCGRCKSAMYCSTTCQKDNWYFHKNVCRARGAVAEGKKWYDPFRKCRDGTSHFGDLELMTWGDTCPRDENDHRLGWGNCFVDEALQLKRKYEEEFGSDDIAMYGYWSHGFRWTCCGMAAGQNDGCDHHGTGPDPCQCDFCHMGKSLPDSIYNMDTLERRGLNLPRGPDPRSFHLVKASLAGFARPFMGMPE
ncbi:uncharacterized protein GGS22DRAFT_196236 [Annulohypoxylon maeteangense]|uniref:uncharacterized protein n=1 Tax=Annulohypoxylon maeteangense TaxID=1927788 RepID=UPI002007F596|nr:uncharacterized protein GGS22DRAFT_196236 [Annulohypoxylon maeteangense]KAI0881667.1 hypothetical protein GGS22DRAFT_196236 [Annulohypoxylon maeteangense]